MARGWWAGREWLRPPGWHARVTIINAFYTAGGHVQKSLPLLLAELLRRDNLAACLAGPHAYDVR